ncbi:GGDEF domain-containing protein [Paenibacillus albidus]|uniref:GGDEF domain-containing protein n=1 Tax=Paenibacillus albidus TaxID=2041023 RepID=UPI001BE75043|nr:GGDEF domain-containing protein [Paenibacillus albidus]MBT2288640.1 GGDEF domain-containing protein [Paenibacillus albidus]
MAPALEPEQGPFFIASNLLIVTCISTAELWVRLSWNYQKQAVVGCGFIMSYLIYFLLEPHVDGAQMALMMPIMVALIYFDRKMLYFLGVFNILFYTGFYIGMERVLLNKPWLEFYLVQCVFIVFVVMANAVIIRSQEVKDHLEQVTKSEQGLMVERAISDKLLKIDALTGLYNHKTFHEYLDSLLEQCENNGLQLQLALFDIDNFKQVNDTYGHWVGDLVLKEVAAKVSSMIGLNDFAARYGGEEFAVIFTDNSQQESFLAAEEMRVSISLMEHPYAGGKPITVSIGLCNYQLGDGKELLFRKTDDALYSAKRGGKNTVCTAAGAAEAAGANPFARMAE